MDHARPAEVPAPPRWPLLGTWVEGFTVASFLDTVAAALAHGGRTLVANHNVNSLTLYQRDPEFRAFYERADHVFIDGTPVVGLARLTGAPARTEHRIGVLDWIWPLLERAERVGWRVAHLGSDQPVISQARRLVLGRHPGLTLTTLSGYFDADDPAANAEVLRRLREARPAVLLVGMGMPRQERWVLRHLDELPDCVVVTVGGIFGYLGGDRPTAPRWLGPLGLEWAFRLATEPRRLWRRYLVEPFGLVPAVARELGAGRTRPHS